MVAQAEAFAHGRRLSESINEHFSNNGSVWPDREKKSNNGKYDQVFPKKDDRNIRADGAIVSNVLPEMQKDGKLDCPVSTMVIALFIQNCSLTCIAKLKL
jgi:cyclin-dependent kinase 12/13